MFNALASSAAAAFMLAALPLEPMSSQIGNRHAADTKALEAYLNEIDGQVKIDPNNLCIGVEAIDYNINLSYPNIPMVILIGVTSKADAPYKGHCLIKTMVLPASDFTTNKESVETAIGSELTGKIINDLRGIEGFNRSRPEYKLTR